MKQMIARVDDELHARLKARAAAEGRSLNDLLVAALSAAADTPTTRASIRQRARGAGLLVVPDALPHVPTLDEVADTATGAGAAVSEALAEERRAP